MTVKIEKESKKFLLNLWKIISFTLMYTSKERINLDQYLGKVFRMLQEMILFASR